MQPYFSASSSNPSDKKLKSLLRERLSISHHQGQPEVGFDKAGHISRPYELILIIAGETVFQSGGEEFLIREHHILFILPGTSYSFCSSRDLSFVKIAFDRQYLHSLGIALASTQNSRLISLGSADNFPLTEEEFRDLYSDILALEKKLGIHYNTPYATEIVRNSFVEIIYDLFLIKNQRHFTPAVKVDSRTNITSRFLKLLSEKFREEKRVNYYASELSLSPRHLSHVVKLTTDKTARELVDEVVINEAKLLLKKQNLNISEVASRLCFSDSSFFGKYFKKQTGLSPSEYQLSAIISL